MVRKTPKAGPEALLRALPGVNEVLAAKGAEALEGTHGREPLVAAVRTALDGLRTRIREGKEPSAKEASGAGVLGAAAEALVEGGRPGLCRVLNATGVVLHTGLGRAVLPKAAMDAIAEEARAYCLLAVEREDAGRGRRERFCEEILRGLTGCEAATVVNNNAAATMLVLNTMAEGKDAILSRGQLVEIGGAFRMPDVMRKAGVRLVEVGCTNKTRPPHHRKPIPPQTPPLLPLRPPH